MEDAKSGDFIRCEMCSFVTRRDLMLDHIIRSHYNNEATEQRSQSRGAFSRIDTAPTIRIKADPKVKEKPKSVEDEKNGELIRCEVCKFVTRRDCMRRHIVTTHGGDDVSWRNCRKAEIALTRIDTAQPIEDKSKFREQSKTEPTATQKAFAYQSSAEFVDESLHAGGAQRHNKDNISLRPSHEVLQATQKRLNLERELAALEEQKKEQAQHKRFALVAQKFAQGLAEVVCGCVVTLYDIEADETISYYIVSSEREYRHKQRVYIENYTTPPHGADECLRADAELAKSLVGTFVGDEVSAPVPNGLLMFRVMSVTNHHSGGKQNEATVTPRKRMSDGQTHARIGSEAYAFFARDNGSFGSFVTHDDYSDEADGEVHGAEAYDHENASSDD